MHWTTSRAQVRWGYVTVRRKRNVLENSIHSYLVKRCPHERVLRVRETSSERQASVIIYQPLRCGFPIKIAQRCAPFNRLIWTVPPSFGSWNSRGIFPVCSTEMSPLGTLFIVPHFPGGGEGGEKGFGIIGDVGFYQWLQFGTLTIVFRYIRVISVVIRCRRKQWVANEMYVAVNHC